MRTLLAREAEGVCSGGGDGVTDSAGPMEVAGDSSGIADGVGVGEGVSCASAAKPQAKANRITACALDVTLSGAQRSRKIRRRYRPVSSRDVSTSLDMTLNVVTPIYVRKKIIAPFALA